MESTEKDRYQIVFVKNLGWVVFSLPKEISNSEKSRKSKKRATLWFRLTKKFKKENV